MTSVCILSSFASLLRERCSSIAYITFIQNKLAVLFKTLPLTHMLEKYNHLCKYTLVIKFFYLSIK